MAKYTYTGTQPFTGTVAGKDVLLGKGDEIDMDENIQLVKVMVYSGLLTAAQPAGNNSNKPEKTKP